MLSIDLSEDQVKAVVIASVVYHWLIANKASSVFVPLTVAFSLKPSLSNSRISTPYPTSLKFTKKLGALVRYVSKSVLFNNFLIFRFG